ncbi:MAG: 3-hydroxyacyl-ACP dehydratase FabZ [Synergistes sp.]|nr:3-hydroxyacyl-ACP dehydratase FabZ [Synergistes sp.]
MRIDISQILEFLPHRYPFLLVDRIEKIVDTDDVKEVTGYKNVTYNEPFFQGHFPDEPIMPGVLILEAMGQVGAVLLKVQPEFSGKERKIVYLTSVDHAKFRRPVKPGDCLRTTARLKRRRGNMGKFEFVAEVDGEIVAEAEMGFMIASELTLKAK